MNKAVLDVILTMHHELTIH